ncbi:MAG: TRAP transporter substrate-binding protein [Pseudomonadota bacterium]
MTNLRTLGLAALVAALAPLSHAIAQDTTLRLHTLVASPHPYNDMAEFMAEEVEKRSDGRIAVRVFDQGQLGKDPAVIGEMGLGTIDLMISSTNNAVQQVPEYQIFSMPYLFAGFDDLMAKVGPGSPAETYFRDAYADRGLNMKLLALGGSGTRNLSTAEGPVTALADIEGIKMRTPPSPMIAKTWETLGTLPVSVAWGELYAAMQTGVAEGLESSIAGYTGSRLYEVAPFMALTAHTIQANHISMSDRAWNRLSPEDQQMIMDVAAEASTYGIERAKFYETTLVDTLKSDHGVTVSEPDVSEFQAALSALQTSLAAELELEEAFNALSATN